MEKKYPLSKALLAMSRIFKNTGTMEMVVAAKGAPEAIFGMHHLNLARIKEYSGAVEEMARAGLRVLAVA